MFDKVPRSILWGGVAIVCAVGAWLTGNYQGHQSARARMDELQTQADTELLRQQALLSRQQQELEQNVTARNIADARAAALQTKLDERLKLSVDDAAELALYRRIGETSSPRGVWVDQVSVVEGEPEMLAITLVQARGRKRATGNIGVALTGGAGGPDRYWVVTDSETGVVIEQREGRPQWAALDAESKKSSDDVFTIEPFDLRFFQTVLVKVKNITTIDPEYIEIFVQPEVKPLKPSVQRFRWAEIRPEVTGNSRPTIVD